MNAERNCLKSKLYTACDQLKERMRRYYFSQPPGAPMFRFAPVKRKFQPFVNALNAMLNSLETAAKTDGDSCDW